MARGCISGITRSRSIACQVALLNRCPYRSIVIVAVECPRIKLHGLDVRPGRDQQRRSGVP